MSEKNEQLKQFENHVNIFIEQMKKFKEINLPKGETKPLEGTTSMDDKPRYISKLVAYHAMKSSAKEIGDQINNLPLLSESKIFVVDKLKFAEMDFALSLIESRFALFEEQMEAQIKENESLAGQSTENDKLATAFLMRNNPMIKSFLGSALGLTPDISVIISSIADIAGYFRVDYDIKGQEFDLDSDAITAIVTGEISRTHDVYTNNFSISDDIYKSEILKCLDRLVMNRVKVETSKEALKDKEKAVSAITESESIIKAFDEFVLSITTAEEGKEQPLIVLATMRDYIKQMGITHLLYLKISSSGGEAITQKRIFGSGHITYMGGSTISYILAQRDGKVISADTLVAFSELNHKIGSGKSSVVRVV